MEEIGAEIVRRGHILVSGNADGADQAWARGGNSVDPSKVRLYLPWNGYNWEAIHEENDVIIGPDVATAADWADAERFHPNWIRLSRSVKNLMVRNIQIVRGSALNLCYLNHARMGGGGTGHGVRFCRDRGVRVVDLSQKGAIAEAQTRLKALGGK